jgi:uroporphyrinogen decarboxylase
MRQPTFSEFRKALLRQGRPAHLPLYEHIASPGFISERIGCDIRKAKGRDYWKLYVDFWLGMGFDCIPMEIPFDLGPRPQLPKDHPAYQSEEGARIFSRDDLDKVKWPDAARPINFEPFEIVAGLIPEGVKIVGGVCAGPFEVASQRIFGVMGLSLMLADDPGLVRMVFEKLGALYISANRILASMDAIGACRQGDDLGFKTSTFLPPPVLRECVFPIYKGMADAAHAAGKPFILHSCGDLHEVYEDLIACGIDAKHSFEDQILPVAEFKKQYGRRITPLGGLDVDFICRSDEAALRAYTRKAVEECWTDGHWALGTGNSLTDYMPVGNYLVVLDEARRVTG